MKSECLNCYFGDKCHCDGRCDYYAPIKVKDNTEILIEIGRRNFTNDWYEYISEYSD